MTPTGALGLTLALAGALSLAACHRAHRPADRFAETVSPDSGFADAPAVNPPSPPQPQPQPPGPGVRHPARDHDRNGPMAPPTKPVRLIKPAS